MILKGFCKSESSESEEENVKLFEIIKTKVQLTNDFEIKSYFYQVSEEFNRLFLRRLTFVCLKNKRL